MKRPVSVLTGLLIALLLAGQLLGLPDRVSRARDRLTAAESPPIVDGEQISLTGRITSVIHTNERQSFYGGTQVIQTFLVSHIHIIHSFNRNQQQIQKQDTQQEQIQEKYLTQSIHLPDIYKIQVTTNTSYCSLKPGNLVQLTGKVRLPRPADVPGGYDMLAYANRRYLLLSVVGAQVTRQKEKRTLLTLLGDLRAGLSAAYAQVMDAEDAAMLGAVTLGDQTELSGKTKRMLREGGIAHILAISGLHINLIGMGLYRLLRRRRAGFLLGGALSAGLLWLYAMMTGMSASAVRASLMFTLWVGSQIFGRTPDTPTALALAAGILLIRSPLMLFDGGFQLSFGCVLSLYLLSPPLQRLIRRGRVLSALYIGEQIAASLAVALGTLPILCWHYGSFNLYAPLLNLLILPQMSILVSSGVLGSVLGWVYQPAGVFFASPCHYLLEMMTLLCHAQERLPYAVIVTGRPALWQIALYYVLLGAGCLWAMRAGKRKLAALMLTVQMTLLLWRQYPDLRIVFLSVGQGDCILVQQGDHAWMVDGGSSSEREVWNYRIEPCLHYYGIRRLEAIFVTHGDGDHISGVEELGERYTTNLIGQGSSGLTVERIGVSVVADKNEALHALIEAFAQKGVRSAALAPGDTVRRGDLTIEALYPTQADWSDAENENSLVLLVTTLGGRRILLTGDLEKEGEERLVRRWAARQRGSIDILKLGHHGSRYATSKALLSELCPQAAIASAGRGNRYGHPAGETLERLAEAGCQVYRTDQQGSIIVEEDRGKLRLRTVLSDQDEG